MTFLSHFPTKYLYPHKTSTKQEDNNVSEVNKMAKGSSGGKGSGKGPGASYSPGKGSGVGYNPSSGPRSGTYMADKGPGKAYMPGEMQGPSYMSAEGKGPMYMSKPNLKDSEKMPQLYQGKETITIDSKVLGALINSYMSLVDAYVSATSQAGGGMYGSQPAPMMTMEVGRMDEDPILELYWRSIDNGKSIDSQVKGNQYLNKPKPETQKKIGRSSESSIDAILNQNNFKQQPHMTA